MVIGSNMGSKTINNKLTYYSAFTIPLLLVIVFLLALNAPISTYLLPNYNSYDIQRILEVSFLLIMSGIIICVPGQQDAWLSIFLKLPAVTKIYLICALILGILSSIFAELSSYALIEFSLYFLLFILIFYVAVQQIILKEFFMLIWFLVIIIPALGYLIFFFSFHFSNLHVFSIKTFPAFLNPRFFSQFQIFSLSLIILPTFVLPKKKSTYKILNYFFYFVAMLWFSLMLENGAKGAIVAFFLANLLLWSVLRNQLVTEWIKRILFVLLGGLIIFMVIFLLIPQLPVFGELHQHVRYYSNITNYAIYGVSEHSRLYLWHLALQLIKTHVGLGVGPMNFATYINLYGAHPHNLVLLIASEWGLPVACIVVGLCAWAIIKCFKKLKVSAITNALISNPRENLNIFIDMSLLVSLLSALLYSLVSGLGVMPLDQLMLCIVSGIIFGRHYQNEIQTQTSLEQISPIKRIGYKCALIILILANIFVLTIKVYPMLPKLTAEEVAWVLEHHENRLHPRFWLLGWINNSY